MDDRCQNFGAFIYRLKLELTPVFSQLFEKLADAKHFLLEYHRQQRSFQQTSDIRLLIKALSFWPNLSNYFSDATSTKSRLHLALTLFNAEAHQGNLRLFLNKLTF